MYRGYKAISGGVRLKGSAADPFVPHSFQTAQLSLKRLIEPTILITPDAYADMLAIAENSGNNEVGWLGTVAALGGGKYLLDGNICIPEQEVHESTNELTEDGIGELFTELATTDFAACERMHFWGHVHPSNSTSPSPQDEGQMNLFAHNDWFIRGIFGRHGRAEFTFFDYENGVRWNDVVWAIHCPVSEERRAKWAAEVAAKVKEIVVPPYKFVRRFAGVTGDTNQSVVLANNRKYWEEYWKGVGK